MKTLFAAAFLAVCPLLRADTLSLDHAGKTASIVTPEATVAPVDERIHLGLDRHEENLAPVYAFAASDSAATGPTELQTTGASLSGQWSTNGAARTPTLDASTPSATVTMLNFSPVGGAAPNSGLPDSWVYAGVGGLLLGVGWLCAGNRSRHRPLRVDYGGADLPSRRAERVKMVPFKTGR